MLTSVSGLLEARNSVDTGLKFGILFPMAGLFVSYIPT